MDTEKNKRLLNRYGILPKRGNLLNHQLEGRKYFDSGDFALNQAHRASNIGNVTTGSEHPIRQDISEPSSSVPGSSNLKDNAGQPSSATRKSLEAKPHPHTQLQQEMESPEEGESRTTAETKGG
ncbi:camp-regulated phospho family Igo1 [Fusarium beomiforme]|uniref:mRNA stability protein n=1 Tax=Fusarium beomiforme TaxID=44412 RepID=A0A9P5E0R0_9HYPO|nr:camp-regulated phospho family Igo1 [Fusarium beomiforme]